MDPRLSMVMVGSTDVSALRRFYEDGLGWQPWGPPTPGSALYKVGSTIFVFLPAAYLAAESGLPAASQAKSLWAVFVGSRQEVDAQFDRAVAAGATVTSAVRDRDGGLYSGYFADPEGNGWEIVWSPYMVPDAAGALTINMPSQQGH